jgi:hypothetical protein
MARPAVLKYPAPMDADQVIIHILRRECALAKYASRVRFSSPDCGASTITPFVAEYTRRHNGSLRSGEVAAVCILG